MSYLENHRKYLIDKQKEIISRYIRNWEDHGDWAKNVVPLIDAQDLIGGLPPNTLAVIGSGNSTGVKISDSHKHFFGMDLFRKDFKDHPNIINSDHYEVYINLSNDSVVMIGPNMDPFNKKDFRDYHHKIGAAPLLGQEIVKTIDVMRLCDVLRKRIIQLED